MSTQHAIIYCRISSVKQLKAGDGLNSQETRCREYAKLKGYEIIKTFHDEGVSGGITARPAMKELLAYLRQNSKKNLVVIIDDLSRLARGLEAHLQLRLALNKAGGKLESPSIEFGEDSDSLLIENLLASVSQHQRQKNAEQTINRMRARASNGYWVGTPVIGYRYKRIPGHGNMLVRDEPVASIVTEALEGYASGRFSSQTEVKRFLDNQEAFPKGGDGKVHLQRVSGLLTRPLYAGYFSHPQWDIHMVQAQHEPLISFKTWQVIQDKLKGAAPAPYRKDTCKDFPLRGFVMCGECGKAMTSCWSSGSHKKYPYYFCFTKGCNSSKKSIPKAKLEEDFETILNNLTPPMAVYKMSTDMMREVWEMRHQSVRSNKSTIKKELDQLERKADVFLDRIADADSHALITSYETKLKKIQEQKIALREKLAVSPQKPKDFEEAFRTPLNFLKNPVKLWRTGRLADQRTVTKLVFPEGIHYCREGGFRTISKAEPFKLLEQLKGNNYEMAHPARFERATP